MLGFLKKWFIREVPEPDPMKYLIVGIGNMGAEYDGTRHNIGFDVVDQLAKDKDATFKNDQLGDLAEIKHRGRTITLLKPSTYVNLSGKAVRYWLQKKNIQQQNLLVIVDDMNLPFGTIRLRGKGADGGHNGLKNISDLMGSNYARLRIGIGNAPKGQHVNFVLGPWDNQELADLPKVIDTACKASLSFTAIGLNHTMNQFNK